MKFNAETQYKLIEALRPVRHWTGWPSCAFAAVLVLFAHSLAERTWALVRPPIAPVAAGLSGRGAARPDISIILTSDIFGPSPYQAAGPGDFNAPVSGLNMSLSGIVAAGPASLALISVDGQPAEPYVLGAAIAGGVTLKAVYKDRVIIDRGGVSESLVLNGAEAALMASPKTSAGSKSGIRAVAKNRYVVPRKLVQEQMSSPDLLTQASLEPEAGGGFRINSLKPEGLLEKLGLKEGQVIRSINGRELKSPQDLLGLYQQLNNSGKIQMDVLENGQTERLVYDLQ